MNSVEEYFEWRKDKTADIETINRKYTDIL